MRLSRLDDVMEAALPIIHNKEGYTLMAGYVIPKGSEAEGSLREYLRLRVTKNQP